MMVRSKNKQLPQIHPFDPHSSVFSKKQLITSHSHRDQHQLLYFFFVVYHLISNVQKSSVLPMLVVSLLTLFFIEIVSRK